MVSVVAHVGFKVKVGCADDTASAYCIGFRAKLGVLLARTAVAGNAKNAKVGAPSVRDDISMAKLNSVGVFYTPIDRDL